MLKDKTIVIGVTGGIAAYKACDIVSRLKKLHANVHVIMTQNASEFVSPLTFQSLSQNPVIVNMFDKVVKWDIQHISLAKAADLFLIAPATANIIGKIANGLADDMLSTTVMATTAPVFIAPAMNTYMYNNKIVQDNISKLKKLNYHFIEPVSGRLACGDIGTGKLASPEVIVDTIKNHLITSNDLKNKKILITAGPTIEPIDPVRYLTNHSTGKMGYSLAKAAIKRGALVTLISGPVNLTPPEGLHNLINVKSADQMYKATINNIDDSDIIIKTAAVADYKPKNISPTKIKKDNNTLTIELTKNKDILYEIGKRKNNQILVGFAAETNNAINNAMKKLDHKNLDLIVLNDVTQKNAGFGSDTNIVTIIDKNKNIKHYPQQTKFEVANNILDNILQLNK